LYKIPANTLFMGRNLVYVPVCHSTNTLATDLCNKTPLLEGTLVITDHQQAGKGQRGNRWQAEPNLNFTFSLILKPTFLAISNQFILNQCISLGIADFINELLSQEVKIKWPNDILIQEKKVCGILIENTLNGEQIQQSVIGIGLNVNQKQFESRQATSLALISKRDYLLAAILDRLLEYLEVRYLQLKRGEFEAIQTDYLSRLFRINVAHQYQAGLTQFEGTITGVDGRGRLKIKTDEERVFDVKEVTFIY
jgi:BirA family transcriptional regulator, biotin operon repressor / biotin---[acetyl-CoA-carboxylase] ligase